MDMLLSDLTKEQRVRYQLRSLVRTHWGQRIVKAAKRGRFTKADIKDAKIWIACACGKMHARKPYKTDPRAFTPRDRLAPEDTRLWGLGAAFSEHVKNHEIETAALVMRQIEETATAILKSKRRRRK